MSPLGLKALFETGFTLITGGTRGNVDILSTCGLVCTDLCPPECRQQDNA